MILAVAFAGVVAFIAALEGSERASAAKSPEESTRGGLVRGDPGVEPWVERTITSSGTALASASASPTAGSVAAGDGATLPLDEYGYPLPTREQIEAVDHARRFRLPPGAIMSLSVPDIELRNVPVFDSDASGALNRGVVHLSDTSLPWSNTPERNVYVAGHRLGWPGTGSHLVFYRLNELDGGERITIRDRSGQRYNYTVLESFTVWPEDNWVTGRVRGRDLLTLQTCTPIPTFEKRLIVRAERM